VLKVQYVMVGGFLGAGKTTAILQLARRWKAEGLRVGLITNDQSIGLVDTAMLRSQGFSTEEITGGCFCCRFNSLREAADKLTADVQPEVFIAEPVGSCTDLRATVSYPLRRMYGDEFRIAPLSVVLDPLRARQVLGLEPGKVFSRKVLYIFEKQMEEADILVINKCDLVSLQQQDELQSALEKRFPHATVLRTVARSGIGVDDWLDLLQRTEMPVRRSMEVDYDEYAEGEALLGWLNVSAEIAGPEFDGNDFLRQLANQLCQRLVEAGTEIAHLKMTLAPETGTDLAVANLVRSEGAVELSHELAEGLDQGHLILNLRAEGDPQLLREAVLEELETQGSERGLSVAVEHAEAFRPGRPLPTHRLAET
jgi:G3E family GTPase